MFLKSNWSAILVSSHIQRSALQVPFNVISIFVIFFLQKLNRRKINEKEPQFGYCVQHGFLFLFFVEIFHFSTEIRDEDFAVIFLWFSQFF